MITHVAEASECSGRLVLWLDPEVRCTPALVEAPVRLAAAYGAEVETIAVSGAYDNGVPVGLVATVSHDETSSGSGEHHFALLVERHRRIVERAGRQHGVTVRHTVASGDPVDRISQMCFARGPWNIVALTRVPALGGHSLVSSLLANVSGATAFLLCGTHRENVADRVVVIAEDVDRLPSMLRVADRLSSADGIIHVVIGAETAAEHAELEAQARLITAGANNVAFDMAGPTFGLPGALLERLAQLKPSLVIARFGGSCLADGRQLARASAAMHTPILLVR
jgi:hypothetical protein